MWNNIRLLTLAFICWAPGPGALHAERIPVAYFGGGPAPVLGPGPFDPVVPRPEEILGHPLGDAPARHARVVEYFRRLDHSSPRLKVTPMGQTYEGRALIYAVVTSASNHERLDAIQANLRRIADPRTVKPGELDALVESTPACLWLAYSIHGDEISGVDAALGVAYQLAAGQDTLTERLLEELVIVIDPCENPDGRERFLAQMEAFATAVPFADGQSLQKGGFWPWGRGNHYLFDMNRDWFALELVESRARIDAIIAWNPQVLVDAHEMGSWDTYLFSPPRAPFNPQLTPELREWWNVFAQDQAAAFDRHGWAYYTREWNEEWFPGYGSSWPLFLGAVGILYEQARVPGSRIARHDGTVMTYAEAVSHQYVSSIANATTTANRRRELLRHYHDHRARAIREFGGGRARAFLVAPDRNRERRDHLADVLARQGIQVESAEAEFTAQVRGMFDIRSTTRRLPKGTMVIRPDQPQGFLIQTILGFDPRLPDSFLTVERRELLKHRDSKLYEVTSWSMLQAYGLEAYEADAPVTARTVPWKGAERAGAVIGTAPRQGYLFEGDDDGGLRAVALLFERGLTLYAALKDLDVDGRSFGRGAIFIPARANPAHYAQILDTVAGLAGIRIVGVESGLGRIGPDLGGDEVKLLRKPRAALVADEPTNFTSLGAVWHLLDQKLGLPASMIPAARLGSADLSIYNVLVLPEAWGSYHDVIGKGAVERLRSWVQAGGTLIAIGSGAAFCADTAVNLASARIRRQVLDKLGEYEEAARQEIEAERPDIAGLPIYDYPGPKSAPTEEKKPAPPTEEEIRKADELGRVLSPHGAILRVDLDLEHWLTFGANARLPVMFYSSYAFLAKFPPARTVGRFSGSDSLRVSGLLWPEARQRLAHSAYLTREPQGAGQVILFADDPNFRAYFRGAERLLANAILFGPGLGTHWMPDW